MISGVTFVELIEHADRRGTFIETFRAEWFPEITFVQGNLSTSSEGVLRGLHYHLHQEDLWFIAAGRALAVLVDLRSGSPSYLKSEAFPLHGPQAVRIPVGVAHGFYAETDLRMSYLVTNYYDGSDENGVAWDDPELGIAWPVAEPTLSDRDLTNPRWADVPANKRPVYTA